MMNCSGGQMPWGSWVTCEETVNGPDVGPDFTLTSNIPLTKPHGYVFEVPASHSRGRGQSTRKPITQAGRFAHEAVSFDPEGQRLYLTEDNFGFPSGFYRYRPPRKAMKERRLLDGGTLQMLKVKGVDNANLAAQQVTGATYDVQWVPIQEPDVTYPYTPGQTAPTPNDTALVHVASQGWERGAAFFSRLEGQVYRRGVVYFTSTQGGGAGRGRHASPGGQRLRQRVGSGLGLRHQAPHAHLRVPVAGPARPGPPGQHHDVEARDPGRLRGQRQRQLHPRAEPQGRAVRHRPQPAQEQHGYGPVQRRVRGVDVQPRRPARSS